MPLMCHVISVTRLLVVRRALDDRHNYSSSTTCSSSTPSIDEGVHDHPSPSPPLNPSPHSYHEAKHIPPPPLSLELDEHVILIPHPPLSPHIDQHVGPSPHHPLSPHLDESSKPIPHPPLSPHIDEQEGPVHHPSSSAANQASTTIVDL